MKSLLQLCSTLCNLHLRKLNGIGQFDQLSRYFDKLLKYIGYLLISFKFMNQHNKIVPLIFNWHRFFSP